MNKNKSGLFAFYPYAESSADEIELYKNSLPEIWEEKGIKMALDLFAFCSESVPAYANFLKKEKVDSGKKLSIEEYKKIPCVTKENYLRTSDYETLFPHLSLYKARTIAATSGSTGEPFFFPRSNENDIQYERMAEIFLKNQFDIDKKKTLVMIGFGLGIWIGGIFTYKNFEKIAEKNNNITLIPVGTNKDLYLKAFKKFAPLYDQTILMGYPPFIKDVLDSGDEHAINWKKFNLKIVTAAEGYSEHFRSHIADKAGIKNIFNDIINMYGTVEQGTLANETALSNLIRHIADRDQSLFDKLFPGATNIPTLAQYYPQQIFFEEIEGKIVATSYGSSIPLVRYSFGDLGGVWSFNNMIKVLEEEGVDIFEEAKKWNISEKILRLPFVYLYARSDFSVTFRGANIYPDEIRTALDQKEFENQLTGRFTLIKKEDESHTHFLEINIELAHGVTIIEADKQKIIYEIVKELRHRNSEFNNEFVSHPEKALPRIVLWPYHDPLYFHGMGKQVWVKKQ